MSQVVIYKQDNGVPAVLMPTEEALRRYSIIEIAVKDVPAGKPFKVIDAKDLPEEYSQEVWSVDEADLTDGIGGESNEFSKEKPWVSFA